ncbi:hypothetical protein [Duncaniella muris]|uniref:hypothetical protein n=1 Tax=Duncaniella muris TaxID=2094150 RepID=UPI003F662173
MDGLTIGVYVTRILLDHLKETPTSSTPLWREGKKKRRAYEHSINPDFMRLCLSRTFVTGMFGERARSPTPKPAVKKETQETASDSDGEEPKKNVVTVVPQSNF